MLYDLTKKNVQSILEVNKDAIKELETDIQFSLHILGSSLECSKEMRQRNEDHVEKLKLEKRKLVVLQRSLKDYLRR